MSVILTLQPFMTQQGAMLMAFKFGSYNQNTTFLPPPVLESSLQLLPENSFWITLEHILSWFFCTGLSKVRDQNPSHITCKNTIKFLSALFSLSPLLPKLPNQDCIHYLNELYLIPVEELNPNGCISNSLDLVNQDEFEAPSWRCPFLKIKSPYSLLWLINFTWSIISLGRRKLLCTIRLKKFSSSLEYGLQNNNANLNPGAAT